MKYEIGNRFILNDPRNTQNGRQGTVVNIDPTHKYPYEIMMDGDEKRILGRKPFTWWCPEDHLVEI